MSDDGNPRPLFDRRLCDIAAAVFRVVASTVLVAGMIGGVRIYGEFLVMVKDVSDIKAEVQKGILPESDKAIARLSAIVEANRRDIDRHEKVLRGNDPSRFEWR